MTDKKLWWQHGIIYQIYPRSFMDSNNDGIGDLEGVLQKLDYLADLGIDAIWFSPIYPSPDVDFGYDVADYCDIDKKFGALDIFDRLLKEAHQRDIHIILDLVLNHTSDLHPWFKESKKSKDNPYHDWYIWRDPLAEGVPPNNWRSVFGGPGWEYVPELDQYYYHMFCKEQPDLNWRNPKVRESMLNVFKFWLERGVDGFRLDVFNMYFKHEKLLDNPINQRGLRAFDRQTHLYDVSQPEMIPLLAEIRSLLDSYNERYVVGETFLADAQHAIQYIGPDRLHAGFDYGYAHCKWNSNQFADEIRKWDALHVPTAWPNYFLNNHDTPRSATRYVKNEEDARLKVLAALHLTVRGTPFLYYGEEIGMRDIKLKRSQILDPVGKRYWPFNKGRDGCRSPMQWNQQVNAGFSQSTTWLPVHPNYMQRNVKNQSENPDSLLNFYKNLIRLRRSHPALYKGSIQFSEGIPEKVLNFVRLTSEEQVMIILNFDSKSHDFEIPGEYRSTSWEVLYSQHQCSGEKITNPKFSLAPYEILLLITK